MVIPFYIERISPMNNSKIGIFLLTTLLIINPCIVQASENKAYSALAKALAQNNPDKALLQELLCGAIESNDQKTIELFFKFSENLISIVVTKQDLPL